MIVQEVADALALVTKAIGDTRELVAAVSDGRKYLERYHPEAKKDLIALLKEIQKSLRGLASVSKVITHFQFTVAGSERDREPARFNNLVVDSKEDVQYLRDHILELRARCDRVRKRSDSLDKKAGGGWGGWPSLLGEKREQRRQELAITMHEVYGADEHIIQNVTALLDAATRALQEVGKALGSRAEAFPDNVPVAAKLLGEYAKKFEPVERECIDLAADLRKQVDSLR